MGAGERSTKKKGCAGGPGGEENARHFSDLVAREETLEIETDKAERARAEMTTRMGEQEKLGKSLDAKAAELRALEAKKAEEFRTWESTLGAQQALLRHERDGLEKDATERKEEWALRKLQLEEQSSDLGEREVKVREDLEHIARSEDEVTRREATLREGQKGLVDRVKAAEDAEQEAKERAFEVDRRERTVREEAAKITDELGRRGQAGKAPETDLAARRTTFEQDATAPPQRFHTPDVETSERSRGLETRTKELGERGTRLTALQENLEAREERLGRESQDLAAATRQNETRQVAVDQLAQRNTVEA